MLTYKKLTPIFGTDRANFLNSLFINFFYLLIIAPGLYFQDDPTLSRYWFFSLMTLYVLIYFRLYYLTKN